MIKKLQKEILETSEKLENLKKQLLDEEKAELEKRQAKSKEEDGAAKQIGADFTALMESWTEYEYEADWGSSQRSDGFRFYKSAEDREKYVKESLKNQKEHDIKYPSPGYSCYWKPDENLKLVKVPKKLWDDLQTKIVINSYDVEIKNFTVTKCSYK